MLFVNGRNDLSKNILKIKEAARARK